MAKLNCALLMIRSVAKADPDCAALRALISPGIASVDKRPIIATTNNRSISVKPACLPRLLLAACALMMSPLTASPSMDNFRQGAIFRQP